MKRDPLKNELFVGTEVENTPYKGQKTLFVAGDWELKEINDQLENTNVTHVYLAANQSFLTASASHWLRLAIAMIFKGCNVTVDLPISSLPAWRSAADGLHFNEEDREFLVSHIHLMLSIPASGISTVNSGITLKLDDDVTQVTNPGVWCFDLQSVLTEQNFTPWSAYADDKGI